VSEPAEESAAREGEPVLLRVHRSPRIGRFVVTGGALGVLLGIVATLVAQPHGSAFRIALSLCVITGLVGGLAGGALALAADRRRGPRAP
jgi:hypothetical protein